MEQSTRVLVAGQGYVGLPLAMAAVDAGHHVVAFEPDPRRCLRLREADSYVEDVPSGRLKAALGSGRYLPVAESGALLPDWDIAVIAVPTPLKDRTPDLSHVRDAGAVTGRGLRRGRNQTVVLESTTHPGTTRDVLVPILEGASGLVAGEDFHVGFSPERIDPGNTRWTFANTPKVVAGLTPACTERVGAFYRTVTATVHEAASLESAELAKILENTFRHVNIALVNEMARLAHTLGIDVWDALRLAGTKPFGFMTFTPGPGVGGHCLPVDPVYLSHHVRTSLGQSFRFVELAQDINEEQPGYVAQRLQDGLNARGKPLNGCAIAALGLSYKAGTADVRQSPARAVVDILRAKGATVDVVDPHVAGTEPGVMSEMSPAGDYDAVVVLTPHPEFDLEKIVGEAAYLLDARGVAPPGPVVEYL
ncbi:nucleotide sugar dehydrogenase [Streptomyces abyssomicinicus]|uniref:nucleotide sugar dehydrogenase n=1 Tax=Streptomyces abyssomicinicus TaxID=574929 RepID=UPI001FE943C7|nr:nucleotide sugar dehydrogenase [Streptomyces abyssomicinicus]